MDTSRDDNRSGWVFG